MPDGLDPLSFRVLGPLRVERKRVSVPVGGPKARGVLAMLLLDANRVVSTDRILLGVWGPEPAGGGLGALQVHISQLRKVLGVGRIETRSPGYSVRCDPEELDLLCLDAALGRARVAGGSGDWAAVVGDLAGALGDGLGEPLADLRDLPFATGAIAVLVERRLAVLTHLAEAQVHAGWLDDAVGTADRALVEDSYGERLWELAIVGRYLQGRQAEALATYQRARSILVEDLGLEPGPRLKSLEAAVLARDVSALGWPEPGRALRPGLVRLPAAETVRVASGSEFVLLGPGAEQHRLDTVLSIGRQDDCTVVVDDPSVSRRHAEIRPVLGGHLLVDRGSTNGTTVDGMPVIQHLLTEGEAVVVGPAVFRYRRLSASDGAGGPSYGSSSEGPQPIDSC